MSRKAKELVATCLYVGFLPGAPGTYASALAAALFVAAGKPVHLAGWLVLLALVAVSTWALSGATEVFGAADPRPVVLDEAAGMWLALVVGGSGEWVFIAIAFVIFRLLDVAKPFPIRRLERIAGWRGIIADDLAAGLVSGLAVRAAVYFTAV